nr:histone deacetylase 14 [Tanacetum cinerariifolium]
MADVNLNVNAPAEQAPAIAPPTRTDDQILPRNRWVPVGKSNCYLDVEKSQSTLIYKIAVDILNHTNFFRAFTASSTIPSIFNNNNPFSSPPTPDALINFVNNMGYPKVVRTLSAVVTNDMFQPWRALTTIINLCLMRKTSEFERPRAPVLQILQGIVNRAHIDYAERMWEEFTQSIHSFVEDKKNLALHTQGKKKANPIVIPSISAKGTKREVFGMPSPNELVTADIQGEQYYKEYLEKIAKHQIYLAGEEGSDPDSPAPKPTQATKKSKPSAPKAAPEKKRKLDTETSDEPSPAKSSKLGLVTKRRKPTSSLRLVYEFVDEGIPEREPRFDDEEADMQRAVEASLKSVYDAHQGPLPPVVFREPDSGKFQPLPEVQRKGKEKVSDEQVALDLLTLQTPKKERIVL